MTTGARCRKCGGVIVESKDAETIRVALQKLSLAVRVMPVMAQRAKRILKDVFGE